MLTTMLLEAGADFIKQGINALKYVVIAVGGGLLVLGIINLLEGYGNDNPGAKSQGMKQAMAGAAVMLVGVGLVPELNKLVENWSLTGK